MNGEVPSEAHVLPTDEVTDRLNLEDKVTLGDGVTSVKDLGDPRDPAMVGIDPVISSASHSVIRDVQNYIHNVQISVVDYFQEENQKLACLVSNINKILNLKSNTTTMTATVQDSVCPINGVEAQSLMEPEEIEGKQIKTEIDELQQLQNIKRGLKQQMDAFHVLATTPHLKTVCQELIALLDEQPLHGSYCQETRDTAQLIKLGCGTAETASVSTSLKIKREQQNSDPDSESDYYSNSDGLGPPKKKLKTAHVVPEEVPLSPEEQVFEIHLLTGAIFKYLDTKSLKNIRLVCKNFNNLSTEILRLNHSLKIAVYKDKVLFKGIGEEIWIDLDSALDSFTKSIKLFDRLPTDYLKLSYTNLEAPVLQQFLSQYGYLVKTLELDLDNVNVSIFAFQHLLLHQVVNLETLFLAKVSSSWDRICGDLKLFRDRQSWIKINSLKKVTINHPLNWFPDVAPTNLLKNLVCASANLEQVTGCSGTNFLAFLLNDDATATASTSSTSLSKLHLMKTFTFNPCRETLGIYSQFVAGHDELHTCLQIQKLEINVYDLIYDADTWPQLASILSQFLRMCSPVLEKLVLKEVIGFLERYGLQFPKFPKVSSVELIADDEEETTDFVKQILPSNCQIANVFPNVQHLTIMVSGFYDAEDHILSKDIFYKYFGNPLQIPSLKTLELICEGDSYLPLDWVKQFGRLAPNVKVARLGTFTIGDFREASRSVWTHLVNLQNLKFTLVLDDYITVTEGSIDAAFTGFSEETCKRLLKEQFERIQSRSHNPGMQKSETVVRPEDWKNERKNPSILDLKSLRSLRVEFKVWSENLCPVFLSCVAGLYGFKMCEKLKVYIGLDRHPDPISEDPAELFKSMETIRPYVTMDSSLNYY